MSSHLEPLLPLVRSLLAAGDEVLVATTEQLAPAVRATGARVETVLADPTTPFAPGSTGRPPLGSPLADKMAALLDVSELTARAKEITALAESFGAELVVRDDSEFAGYLAGEQLDLPVICVAGAMSNTYDHEVMATVLDLFRAELGLPPLTGPAGLYPGALLDYLPESASFSVAPAARTLRFRQPLRDEPGARLPAIAATGERPLVYAAIGTGWRTWQNQGHGGDDPFRAMADLLAALSEVNCTALVSSGGMDTDGMPRGAHVEVHPFLPQQLVLEASQLFCAHGGYNGIREAIRAGVPMLLRPSTLDQPANAAAMTRLGLGATISGLDVGQLTERIAGALEDTELAGRSRAARAAMLALPGVDTASEVLRTVRREPGE
ncbi:glycosyltransferase [Streptomyces sp. NPDC052114]|uniref:glycosyltransferase n=1 Tax=unclassified Streptomyces TaxID=2593676 RepID=UPI0034146BD9